MFFEHLTLPTDTCEKHSWVVPNTAKISLVSAVGLREKVKNSYIGVEVREDIFLLDSFEKSHS